MSTLHGVFAVVVTHFDEAGNIDYASIKKHVNKLIDAGVHGLLPVGATGEFASLTLEERKDVAAFVANEAAGRVPVVVGAVSQNVATVIAVAEHAASIGAAGIMALLPPGLHTSQEEAYSFYKHLSANVSLPVMVYNNPGSCGVDITPETMARIAALPHMDYLKESTGCMKRLTLMTYDFADSIVTFCGSEDLAFESFFMGAKGWVSVLANIAPVQAVQIYELTKKGDFAGAQAVYKQVLPILRLFESTGELWQVVKYVLKQQGIGSGCLRMPRLPISADVKVAVDAFLQQTKLS